MSNMSIKEWMVPGVIIALISSTLSVGGSYAVNNYRLDKAEETSSDLKRLILDSQRTTNERFDRIWNRLDAMGQSSVDMARLQEQNRVLAQQMIDLRGELKEINGKNDARYDNISTRLARQGF